MSRREPRGRQRQRQRNTSRDNSQRILQIALIGAGVLFLVVGAVIAGGFNLSNIGGSGGDNGANAPSTDGQTPTPQPSTEQPAQTTTDQPEQSEETTEKTTTKTTETETKTKTPQQTETPTSGRMSIIERTDKNGNGYISDFNIKVVADTRLKGTDDGAPYFVVKINGQTLGWTPLGDVKQKKRSSVGISISAQDLEKRQYKRGPLQITVKLMYTESDNLRNPNNGKEIKSWTKTVNYEPE